MIVWKFHDDGGFTAGDTATGRTAYAYPSSLSASLGETRPRLTAHRMVQGQHNIAAVFGEPLPDYVLEYDSRNWVTLLSPLSS